VKLATKLRVKNRQGIHTRPATAIVKLLHQAKADVQFVYKKDTINAKSILSILMLALHQNDQITVIVDGDDAEDVMARLVNGFETCFGEN
jgi:phosphocarrier protein HPr